MVQILSIPGSRLDIGGINADGTLSSTIAVFLWLLRTGLPRAVVAQLAVYILALAMLGIVSGFRAGRSSRIAVGFSCLLIVISLLEVIVLSNSRLVLQRYVLFVLPYLLLLVAYGALTLARLVSAVPSRARPVIASVTGALFATILITLFGVGALNYYNPETFAAENIRPDYKGAASYLSKVASPGDTIVVASDPAHAFTVLDFYWRESPPVPVFDAIDPRLYSLPTRQRIFVVTSVWGGHLSDRYFREAGFNVRYTFGTSTAVVRIDAGGKSNIDLMRAWARSFASTVDSGRLPMVLQGSLYQADGDVTQATELYAEAMSTFPTSMQWREHLDTANGYSAKGNPRRAWRELLVAKLEGSGQSDLHRRLAQALTDGGFDEQAQQEEHIAVRLEAMTASKVGQE
jgi:hypothetical protein